MQAASHGRGKKVRIVELRWLRKRHALQDELERAVNEDEVVPRAEDLEVVESLGWKGQGGNRKAYLERWSE